MDLIALMLILVSLTAGFGVSADNAPVVAPQQVTFHPRGDNDITLEGVFTCPVAPPERAPAVVICHPHPLYGGTMNNAVVRALEEAFAAEGYATLRFSFRGVGHSTGKYDGNGAEAQDVLGALDFLLARPEVNLQRVAVAGYSFGAWTGLQAVAKDQEHLRFFVGVGFPIAPNTVDFASAGFVRDVKLPMLFVSGSEDTISSAPDITRLLALLGRTKQAQVVTIDGTDHFWGAAASVAALKRTVSEFVKPLTKE